VYSDAAKAVMQLFPRRLILVTWCKVVAPLQSRPIAVPSLPAAPRAR
jgi:hypothetical protein